MSAASRAEALRGLADRVEAGTAVREAFSAMRALMLIPDALVATLRPLLDAGAYLDAASAFTEAVLPGHLRLRVGRKSDCWASWYQDTSTAEGANTPTSHAPTEPAARLAAALRAMAVEADNA